MTRIFSWLGRAVPRLDALCIWAPVVLAMVSSSCVTSKPVQYFSEQLDTGRIQDYRIPDPVIERGDIMNIVIYSDNPEATLIFNQAGAGGAAMPSQGVSEMPKSMSSAGNLSTAYQVDNAGRIRMHAIGEIVAEGLTRKQLEALVTEKISTLDVLKNPYCIVRFSNFKVTVLGDVMRPGTFTVPVEKVTLLEAMSLAGEVSMSGRRDNLMIVRETGGKRTFAKLSLADPKIFESPYFYMKQNDVLIVNADSRKITPSDQQTFQFLNLALSLFSILIVMITTIFQ
jgi:polysaccharide export outer membrane protein